MAIQEARATGRRKTAVARVFMRKGAGAISINGRPAADYFVPALLGEATEPLGVTDSATKYDLVIRVTGGGIHGQAGACRLGIARALLGDDETNRATLRANGMLTRDRRMVERKKSGQPKARRRFQFSKR
jgi:small subunit ribosomal protein S9